jgi:hypothetical protein
MEEREKKGRLNFVKKESFYRSSQILAMGGFGGPKVPN